MDGLKHLMQSDALANALHREQHVLAEMYRLKGVDFSKIREIVKEIEEREERKSST